MELMDDNEKYYLMMEDGPWAGPNPEILDGLDIDVTEEVLIGPQEDIFDVILQVEDSADDPQAFQLGDIYSTPDITLYSEAFIKLLENHGVDNIEYFDAEVTYEPSGSKPKYKVANIIGKISCVDEDKSKLRRGKTGLLLGFDSIVFDISNIHGQKIFRLAEDETLVVVHSSIKIAVEKAGLKDFLFVSDKEWQSGMV